MDKYFASDYAERVAISHGSRSCRCSAVAIRSSVDRSQAARRSAQISFGLAPRMRGTLLSLDPQPTVLKDFVDRAAKPVFSPKIEIPTWAGFRARAGSRQ